MLLKEILDCDETGVDDLIEGAIQKANDNGHKVGRLGFVEGEVVNNPFCGFIPLDTRIKYSNVTLEDYGMQTTDFMYEFAHFVKKYDINTTYLLIRNLEYFINSYFGLPGENDRSQVFCELAWNKTKTDEEYFAALDKNVLGDLKHKDAAECTERSAVAQQILSLFGYECYYCMGNVDWKGYSEAHCFNIVKREKDYALLDYSLPVNRYTKDGEIIGYDPFIGIMSNEDFIEFSKTGVIKGFENYKYVEGKRIETVGKRLYVVGDGRTVNNEQVSDNILDKDDIVSPQEGA